MPKYNFTWIKYNTESILECIEADNYDAAVVAAKEPHPTDDRWVIEDNPTVMGTAELAEDDE